MRLATAPLGWTAGTVCQDAPSHTWARETWTPAELTYVPTPRQPLPPVQVTPYSALWLGLGVCGNRQLRPFQPMARVPNTESPTASQLSGPAQATELSAAGAPAGSGADWRVHV